MLQKIMSWEYEAKVWNAIDGETEIRFGIVPAGNYLEAIRLIINSFNTNFIEITNLNPIAGTELEIEIA